MRTNKGKILVLYTAGEFPARKTVWSFIYSFRRFSGARVFYHNLAFSGLPWFLRHLEYDLVIFSHFMTTPWNRKRYLERIGILKGYQLKTDIKVAFFQDEYFNTDLTNKFIVELGVTHVFSVAPESEWKKLYSEIPKNVAIFQYLTGYVDPDDIAYCNSKYASIKKNIDVGYRTGWPSKEMFRLGAWGALKFEVAEVFTRYGKQLNLDIGIGKNILTGKRWFDFLLACKYTIGVESGASLLDFNGSIYEKIQSYLKRHPESNFREVENHCFHGLDGNLSLKAISPRIFEAALTKTCMVLVEGDYNGLLIPDRHYIPLKADFSNIEECIDEIRRDERRETIVQQTYHDLVECGACKYSDFIEAFALKVKYPKTPLGFKDMIFYYLSCVTDFNSWVKAAIWSQVLVRVKKRLFRFKNCR